MRNSTREKLFDDGDYLILWSTESEFGTVSLLSVGGVLTIIHEFTKERDGFEVYVRGTGNTIDAARLSMGLKPKEN